MFALIVAIIFIAIFAPVGIIPTIFFVLGLKAMEWAINQCTRNY